jgi:hypothetical protein
MTRSFVIVLGILNLIGVVVAVSPHPVQAASSLGLTLGVNSAGVQGDDTSGGDASGTYRFSGGVFLRHAVREWLAVEPALLYTQKGGYAGWVQDGEWPHGTEFFDLRLSYLELPIVARLGLPLRSQGGLRFDLLAGPYFAVTLRSTMESTWEGGTPVEAELDDVRPIDLGGVLGIGVVVPTQSGSLGIDLRYVAGFLAIRDMNDPPDVRNSGLTLTAGYSRLIGHR